MPRDNPLGTYGQDEKRRRMMKAIRRVRPTRRPMPADVEP